MPPRVTLCRIQYLLFNYVKIPRTPAYLDFLFTSSLLSSSCNDSGIKYLSLCVCWKLSWLVFSVTGWLMGLICPTVLCVRRSQCPHWRTWVKERIIDSDKALPALIAAGELDYLFKVPSLAEGEPYQWSPDWPHIVLLWTCSGRAQGCVCTFVRMCVCFGLKLLSNFHL